MLVVIIYGILVLMYIGMPFWLQIIFTLINTVVADPIPVLDEIIMYGTLIKRVLTFMNVVDFIERYRTWCTEHGTFGKIVRIAVPCLIIYFLWSVLDAIIN